jgi:hypothetical protein
LAAQEAERLRRAADEQAGGPLAHDASWGPPPSSPVRRQEAWDRAPECTCCGAWLEAPGLPAGSSSTSSSGAVGVVCDTVGCGGSWCQACAEAGNGGCLLVDGGVFYCGTCAVRPAVQAAAAAAREAADATAAAAAAGSGKKKLVLNLGLLKEEAETAGDGAKRLKLVIPKAPESGNFVIAGSTSIGRASTPGAAGSKVLRAKTVLRFAVRGSKGEVEGVRREAWAAGYPLLEEYDYQRDSRNQV